MAYHYHDKNGSVLFSLGPVSFTINKGEIIFVTGGNGSGKSTLVKLIGGLYFPASGNISIDGTRLTESDYKAYRTLFSIITSDFYLFKRLYGLDSIDENLIFKYLKTMKLETKTGIANKEFTNIQLSTGQRKRLAMIVSLLHDRQIFILDEWAADQDVSFRKYYYETLLTELKRKGKTLIVVSHDDRFYHLADKVIKLEYGDSLETQCSASLHKTI
jgi:putative ATP-binding cassette transporter